MNGQRAVLVTGASSGMGQACVERLSAEGFLVFAGVRKERDLRAIRDRGAPRQIPVILDVTQPETVAGALRNIGEAVGGSGLAGLVNNAGIAVTGPLELLPVAELRRQFEVNVFGQIALTQACLPLLRAARGRIVNVGSVGARFALPFAGPLNASKAAFESLSDSLRMELQPWGIRVILVSPGSIRTAAEAKLVANAEATVNAFSAEGKSLYASAYQAFVRGLLQLESHGMGPEVVATTVHRALTATVPRRRYPVGPNARLLPLVFGALPAGVADALRLRIFHLDHRRASTGEH
jgi:NAD(P)-dependent dehydrogenase (short-subunit alcohol dehydrogenase family)